MTMFVAQDYITRHTSITSMHLSCTKTWFRARPRGRTSRELSGPFGPTSLGIKTRTNQNLPTQPFSTVECYCHNTSPRITTNHHESPRITAANHHESPRGESPGESPEVGVIIEIIRAIRRTDLCDSCDSGDSSPPSARVTAHVIAAGSGTAAAAVAAGVRGARDVIATRWECGAPERVAEE